VKQLFRSKTNRVIAGICGGIGDMVNIDPVIIRLLAVFLCVITGLIPGVITYIVAIFIVPEKPD
jgi:phage shock protein C